MIGSRPRLGRAGALATSVIAAATLAVPAGAQGLTDPAIEGVDWTLARADGATLRLADGTATVADACGTMSVDYTIEPDIVGLRFGPASSGTLCEDTADAISIFDEVDGYELTDDGARFVDAGARPLLALVAPIVETSRTSTGTWVAVSHDGFGTGTLTPPLEGSSLTVTFGRDGSLEGTTGCGEYTGAYGFEGDAVSIGIRTTGVSPCDFAVRDEEVDFTSALQSASNWVATESGIGLLDADGLVRVSLERSEGTGVVGDWTVVRFIDDAGELIEPLPDPEVVISFDVDGLVEGSTGCRIFDGEVLLDGERIVIGEVEPEGRPCRRRLRRQERRFLAAIDAAATWSRDGRRLELSDGSGQLVVVLTAR